MEGHALVQLKSRKQEMGCEAADNFASALRDVKKRCGNELLDKNDLLLLAAEEILHSTTWEEKKYTTRTP